jgi:putative ABC transport system permease protein
MDSIIKDFTHAFRSLLRHPMFTIVAVITLALGLGANTAIFTVVNAVLLRPLPFEESERLMMIGTSTPTIKLFNATKNKFFYWREHSKSFDGLTTFRSFTLPLAAGTGEPDYVSGLRVSEDFFKVFKVYLQLGRTFSDEENVIDGPRAVILSDRLWKRLFGGRADVINTTVLINSNPYTVIGVMPDFWFETKADLITPLQLGTSQEVLAGGANYPVVGRLRVGVTRDQALSEMNVIAKQFGSSYAKQMADGEGINIVSYQESMVGEMRTPLLVLLGAVAFVLLIACANVANLQLSRAVARTREIAIRAAVGASRWRVVRHLVIEGLVLSIAGGIAGLLLAGWSVAALKTIIPEGMLPRADQIAISSRVFFFTAVVSTLAGILFGLTPALQSTRLDLTHALKEATRTGSRGRTHGRFRNALVVSQVSLALVLLVGATLLIRTFANLRGTDPGFDSSHLLTFELAPRGPQYATTAQVADFNERAIQRIKSLPGIENVATTSTLPLRRWLNLPIEFESKPGEVVSVEWRMLSDGYFDAMKMRLTQGRSLSPTDTGNASGVVVVNEAFVRRHFKTSSPLGQRLMIARVMGKGLARPEPLEVVGVVSDNKQISLKDPPLPTVYVPTSQVPDGLMANFRSFYFVIRTSGDPLSYAAAVRREVLALDSQQPPRNIRTMEDVIATSIASPRFNMLLLALFGAIGLTLSAIGIYGVMAYGVSQRTQEFGIRMALGAQMKDVLTMVLTQGMKLTLIGVVIGLAASFALTRWLKTLLFGIQPTDLMTLVIVSIVLVVVALVASYIPARRATKVDPLIALRYE